MDATMTIERTYRPLGFAAAFGRQFQLLWTSRRPLLLLAASIGLMVLGGEPWNDSQTARLFTAPVWPIWLLFVGPLWAFGVWYNEGPSNRLYLWSQPVPRTAHSLARVAAGIAWLWVVAIATIAAGLLFALFDGEASQFTRIGAIGWANFFAAPLIGYLIISVLTIPSDYPIRWFFGILFLVPLTLSVLAEWLDMEQWLQDTILRPLTDRDWGLGITMFGGFGSQVAGLEEWLYRASDPSYQHRMMFDAGSWWVAMPLWVLFWLILVVAFATRHPDRFPRLRRRG